MRFGVDTLMPLLCCLTVVCSLFGPPGAVAGCRLRMLLLAGLLAQLHGAAGSGCLLRLEVAPGGAACCCVRFGPVGAAAQCWRVHFRPGSFVVVVVVAVVVVG